MQSPGPGPQDPDAETRQVEGTPAGSRPDPGYPGSAELHDDAARTRLVGENAGGYQPGHASGWPPVGQPLTPAQPGFPPAAPGRPLNDPYSHESPYGRGDPRHLEDPYGEEAQTRILPDNPGHGYPPGSPGGQGQVPGGNGYPPTAAYPPAGGYGALPHGGLSDPGSGGFGGSPGYPPAGYQEPGGYPGPGAGYSQGYQQQGYQQPGYPAAGDYQQGYPPVAAYGAYPPPGSGPTGGPRPGGSGRRWTIIIGAAVVAVVLLIVIPVVLLTRGSDDGNPLATASAPPSALPTTPAGPSATSSASPSPSPSPSPSASTAFTPAESELVAKLDSSAMTDCKPNSDAESDRILASLYCNSDDGKVVAAYAYATAGDLANDIDVRKSRVTTPNGTCKEGGSQVFTWNFDQDKTQGTAVCTALQSSHFIFWSYDNKLVSFMATGTDGVALYEWWSGFNPVPQS